MGDQYRLLWLFAFEVGLVVFLVLEVRKWRRLGSLLSARQRTLRVVNVGVLALIVGLLAVSSSGLVPSVWGQLAILTAVVFLVVVVMALTIRDLRELHAARLAGETQMYSDMGQMIRDSILRERCAQTAAPPPTDEDAN